LMAANQSYLGLALRFQNSCNFQQFVTFLVPKLLTKAPKKDYFSLSLTLEGKKLWRTHR